MTLFLVLVSQLEVIDWITKKAYFPLCTQSGSLDYRYLSNFITSSNLLTNILIFRIKPTGLFLGIRKAKS